jgi:ABC-type Zn uptake system ZnuABC Zn-binding protein ZnuA
MVLWPAAALLLMLALGGCADSDNSSTSAELSVVATTSQVTDLVREVGGRRVEVHGILGSEADPHDYEPRPSDVTALADAAVVFKSGGDLDEWLNELIDSAGADGEVVTLFDAVRKRGGDPHWWHDPRNAALAAEAIRDALSEADPDGQARYERNAARFIELLRRVDREIEACIARVPRARRKIVTTHDSLDYFAGRYGIEVIGAVIPSLSTQAQPSAKEISALVDQVEQEGVAAVFPESALDDRLEAAVSREAGADVGEPLYTDSLGAEGTPAATYVGSMRENARRLALGMSDGTVRCFGG